MRNFMKAMFLKQREKFDQETRVRNANFQIPDDIKLVENIPYLNDSCPAHTMDIYRPASLVPSHPVIINVHGGGLMEGSKEFNRRFCIQLCRQNFVVFSIEYRLIPDVTVYEQLDDVSRAVNISPYYFSKIFKENTGENFIEYLTNIRIDKAKELLGTTEYSMKEICSMVGYSDPNYFSRSFKKNVGVTPTEYKEGRGK